MTFEPYQHVKVSVKLEKEAAEWGKYVELNKELIRTNMGRKGISFYKGGDEERMVAELRSAGYTVYVHQGRYFLDLSV